MTANPATEIPTSQKDLPVPHFGMTNVKFKFGGLHKPVNAMNGSQMNPEVQEPEWYSWSDFTLISRFFKASMPLAAAAQADRVVMQGTL